MGIFLSESKKGIVAIAGHVGCGVARRGITSQEKKLIQSLKL